MHGVSYFCSALMQPFDPSGRYTSAQVLDVLTSKFGGRQVDFRYDLLSSANVKKADLVGVLAGSVSYDASADVKRSASFTFRDGVDTINYLQDRVRPWWRVRMPDGLWVEWPQGVFLLSSPARVADPSGTVLRTVDAYDQGVVLSSDGVPDRYSIPAGQLFTDAIRTLVAGLIPTIQITPSLLTLPVGWDYEVGTSRLTILNDLLSAMNYRSAWFDENGVLICQPYVLPDAQPVAYTYAVDAGSVLLGEVQQGLDLFDVPNRWVLVVSDADQGSFTSTITNIAPASPTSVPSRGRTITVLRDGLSAADQATLNALAAKTAYEESQVFETETFTTAVMPFHQNADVLALTVPALGLGGAKVEELSWSYELRVGAQMAHQVRRVVSVV